MTLPHACLASSCYPCRPSWWLCSTLVCSPLCRPPTPMLHDWARRGAMAMMPAERTPGRMQQCVRCCCLALVCTDRYCQYAAGGCFVLLPPLSAQIDLCLCCCILHAACCCMLSCCCRCCLAVALPLPCCCPAVALLLPCCCLAVALLLPCCGYRSAPICAANWATAAGAARRVRWLTLLWLPANCPSSSLPQTGRP